VKIYTDLTFCNKLESILKYFPEKTFISGGLSKGWGAGGWRVWFFCCSKSIIRTLKKYKKLWLVNPILQSIALPNLLLPKLYEGDFMNYKSKTINILRSVGNYVYNNLKSNKVLINPPQGAFYLMPEFPNKKFRTSSELCETILDETGVAMLPASDFGFGPKKMLTRLCYIDFDGSEFLKAKINGNTIDDRIIEKYAPNVVEGTKRLSNWAKNL
jgi:Aspartate/tyrosine/aromatic aminotransferase